MDIHNLVNGELEFEIGNKKYKIKRLSVSELFTYFQKIVKEEYLKNVSELTRLLDKEERSEFLRKAMKDMPSGSILDNLAQDKMSSIDGALMILYKAMNKVKGQEVSMDEIIEISSDKNSDVVSQIISYAIGQDKIKEEEAEEAEKKTIKE